MNNNNNNNRNNGIKANKTQQIKLVDIDVKQAKKDIDEIAKYADKKFSDLKNRIGNIGFNGGVSPISFASSRSSNSGGSSLAQSANRPAYTGGKTTSINEYFSSSSGLNFGKIASSLNGGAQSRYEAKRINSINSTDFSKDPAYKRIMKNLEDQVKSGELTQDGAKKLAQSIVKKDKIDNLLTQSAEKFSKSGDWLQAGAKVMTKAGEILMQGVTKGISNQTNAYESTFTNIAVRSGMTNSQYRTYQGNLAGIGGGTIGDYYDNIRTSDIQNQMNNLANIGADSNTILARSMEDVITKTIVPYLDTSSVIWSQLSATIPNIDKQVRGINSANQKIVGNNYTTEKILNDMLYQVQPMGELAVEQLGKSSGQLSAITNQLMAKGFNEEDAYQIAKEQFNMRYRGASILQNGTVREQMQLINVLDKGQNINDLSQSADIAGTQLESDLSLANILPKMGESTIGNVLATAGGDNLGFNGTRLMSTQNLTYKEIETIVKKANDVGALTDEEAEKMAKKLANGDLQTKKTKQDIAMENITNDLDTIIEDLGYTADIIKTAIEAIGTLLLGKFILGLDGGILGKGIGKLAGIGSGAGAGILAAGGGIALGLTAAGIIAQGINDARTKRESANVSQETKKILDNNPFDPNEDPEAYENYNQLAQVEGKLRGVAEANHDNGGVGGFFHDFGQSFSQVWDTLGYELGTNFGEMNATDRTKHSLNTLKTNLDMQNTSKESFKWLTLTFAALADSAGLLDAVSSELGGITREDIKFMVKQQRRRWITWWMDSVYCKSKRYWWSKCITMEIYIWTTRYNKLFKLS